MPHDETQQAWGRAPACLRWVGGAVRPGLAVGICVALVACNTPVGTEVTRATARSVVNPIVAERFPGVPLQPTTDCIINNASSDELLTLAASAATQDQDTAVRTVLAVAQRPNTVECIAAEGLPVLLNTL